MGSDPFSESGPLLMSEYVGIVVTFVLAGALVGAFILLASTLGPKMPSVVKSEPFECGVEPLSLPTGRLSIKFYLTAILFILFDVELVFLYPWAVVFRDLGMLGLAEIVIFLGVLMAGFFYAWDNGALEWQ
jgi:NADH-quinone oxidoreductase subunit A